MEKDAFVILKNIEDTWWHYGRRQAVKEALTVAGVKKQNRVLDAGAGYGGMFGLLSLYGEVDASEPEHEALMVCKERGYKETFISEKDALVQNKQYDLIGAFDVIEHVDDDATFVSNLSTLTNKSGLLVATVPAFQFLWSEHDVHHMHFRRHTIASMKRLFEGAGYDIEYARYWNVFLFPVALVSRLLGKSGESGLHPHPFITSILKGVLWFESKVIRYIPIPFGLSVVIVGRKK